MENYQDSLDAVFHALSDPTRRAVIQRLGSAGDATISDLAEPFDMALPSFMKHISVLESSGLISSTKSGRVRTCRIETDQISAVEKWIDAQRALWTRRIGRLAEHAEAISTKDVSK